MERVRVGGQLSEEVRVTSGVPQGSVLGPLLFLAYVNDVGRNIESTIKLFADDCIIYRKIINSEDMEKLQKDVDRLWGVDGQKCNENKSSKSKAVSFTRARVKDPLNYLIMDTLIPEASSCKHLGIILRSDLSWADRVNYSVKKAWKALHFTMRILKKGNSNTRSLGYMSLVHMILEYGAACWDLYRKGQISVLDKVQKKAAKFAHHTNSLKWETLALHRKLSCLCALYKAYCGEQAWKAMGNRLK